MFESLYAQHIRRSGPGIGEDQLQRGGDGQFYFAIRPQIDQTHDGGARYSVREPVYLNLEPECQAQASGSIITDVNI